MRALDAKSVNCVVTSPPYFWQRDYEVEGQIGHEATIEAYVTALVETFRETYRVLADDGVLAAPTAWLFGNEAHGLPADLAALADRRVTIPIHGRAESLNLSTAAAICLYASARAHR